MLWDVVVPSAMPELLNGIRTALALSFILLVSSELIVAQQGLGYLIGFLGANGSYDAMFAVVLTVAFLGFAADRLYHAGHAPGAAMAATRADRAGRARRRPRRSLRAAAAGASRALSSIIVLAVAWEWFARTGAVTPFMLPPLSAGAGAHLERRRRRRPPDQHRRDALSRAGRLRDRRASPASCSAWRCRAAARAAGSSIRSSRSASRCRRSPSCRS